MSWPAANTTPPAIASAPTARLVEHARQFPDGELHGAREAARIDALCRLGDVDAAAAVARELRTRHRDSVLVRKYERGVCEGP